MTRYWFISSTYRRNSKLALFTIILAMVVILLGAYTRLTNAGLSCPDWPNCYGYLTAPHTPAQLQTAATRYPASPINTKKAWTEMTHRYFAGTEGILVLILAFSILFTHKTNHFKASFIGFSLIILLGVQVTLGMLTVTEKLKPVIVLAHLLTGLSLLSVLWWSYLDLHLRDDHFIKRQNTPFAPWFWIALLLIAMQITLGGWVSTHYAGLACVDFPYCNGQILPKIEWGQLNSHLISIQMLHRVGALITGTYLALLSLSLLFNSSYRGIATLILSLLALQITLGVLNIVWLLPVWVALLHHAVAMFLLLTIITALVKIYFESQDSRHASLFT